MKIQIGKETLYYEHTTKFKSISMGLYIQIPYDFKTYYNMKTLISLMEETNAKYKTPKELENFENDNYGLGFRIKDYVEGDIHTILFFTQFVNPKYLPEKIDLVSEAYSLLYTILLDPYYEDYQIEIKIQSYINSLKNEKNNKSRYCYRQFLKNFLPNTNVYERISLSTNDILNTTTESLKNTYQILLKGKRNFYFSGDYPLEKVQSILSQYSFSESLELNFNLKPYELFPNYEKSEKREKINSQESYLYVGYLTNIYINSNDEIALQILTYLLGGDTFSEGYRRIREEKGLCYYIDTGKLLNNGGMYFVAQIAKENYQEVLKTIKEIVNDFQNGKINKDNFENLKAELIANVEHDKDYLDRIRDDVYRSLNNLPLYTYEERKERIANITIQDIIEVARKLKLKLVYLFEEENR